MLAITIPSIELFDERTQEFVITKEYKLQLEHSLVSIAKWEAKWHKPFLVKAERSSEEILDYIRCMTITQNIPDDAFKYLTNENIIAINNYIESPMTATVFGKQEKSGSKEIMTTEMIYYYMIACGIPFECQKWHFNRLITLINICNIKSQPPVKMNKRDLTARNKRLNQERRQRMNTKG